MSVYLSARHSEPGGFLIWDQKCRCRFISLFIICFSMVCVLYSQERFWSCTGSCNDYTFSEINTLYPLYDLKKNYQFWTLKCPKSLVSAPKKLLLILLFYSAPPPPHRARGRWERKQREQRLCWICVFHHVKHGNSTLFSFFHELVPTHGSVYSWFFSL